MKQPRPRIHLLDVEESLLGFHGLTMRCGVELRNAKPKFMLTEELVQTHLPLIGTCQDCQSREPDAAAKRRYVYGLVEAQSAQDAESEEETDG